MGSEAASELENTEEVSDGLVVSAESRVSAEDKDAASLSSM